MNTLEKSLWNEGLSIGNPEIDSVHKQIIELYYDLVDALNFNLGREEFAKILSGMFDYGMNHFKKEEEYMRKFSFPGIEEHIKYHKGYLLKVSLWNSDFLSPDPPNEKEVMKYLATWWIHHIDNVDREYEVFKKKARSIVVY